MNSQFLNAPGPANGPSASVRVLVVDDNPAHRQFGRCLFESLGCRVWTAENGAEAVRLARALTFEIIVLDRHMPVCDGDAAAASIREAGASRLSRLISHSSNPPSGRAAQAYDVVVPKPARVVDVVHLVTAARRAARPLAA